MVSTVREINTLVNRWRGQLEQGHDILRDPQRERSLAACDYLSRPQYVNMPDGTRAQRRVNYTYGVSPTGTGKTTLGVTMIVDMNSYPSGEPGELLGTPEGRRALVHVPTNHLLTQWEDEMLGRPGEDGIRTTSHFPCLSEEHVGTYRASCSYTEKCEALQKPIVNITYASAMSLVNASAPSITDCDDRTRNEVVELLRRRGVDKDEVKTVRELLKQGEVPPESTEQIIDIVMRAREAETLTRQDVDDISDLLGIDFTRQNQRLRLHELFMQLLNNEKNATIAVNDETDQPCRGPATRRYLQNYVMGMDGAPNCLTVGFTATHLYPDGSTTGAWVYGGAHPCFETLFQEAINNRELTPMHNIVYEVDIPPGARAEIGTIVEQALQRLREQGTRLRDLDYSEAELMKMVRLSNIDELAIDILFNERDDTNGRRYLDMKSIWFCANVGHAQDVAKKINERMTTYLADPDTPEEDKKKFAGTYAEAVHGRMEEDEFDGVIMRYRDPNGTHATTNAQILGRGFDLDLIELGFQLCPSRSPGKVMQEGGRLPRLSSRIPDKIANLITFAIPGVPQVIFGQLAGGLRLFPNEGMELQEEQQTRTRAPNPRSWLASGRVGHVVTDNDEFRFFLQRRRNETGELPNRRPDMLTCEEVTAILNPHLRGEARRQLEEDRVHRLLFDPLSASYDARQANQAFVGLHDVDPPAEGEAMLAMRGQQFPVADIGYYNVNGTPQFCIRNSLLPACRRALVGDYTRQRPPEFLTISAAQQAVLGSRDNNEDFNTLVESIRDAYIDRARTARAVVIDGASFPTNLIGYFARPGGTGDDFCFHTEALRSLYQLVHGVTEREAQQWWDENYTNYKTREWLNEADVRQELTRRQHDITGNSTDGALGVLWRGLQQDYGRARMRGEGPGPYAERALTRSRPEALGTAVTLLCANRLTPGPQEEQHRTEMCLHRNSVEAVEYMLGLIEANELSDSVRPPRGRNRRAGGNGS